MLTTGQKLQNYRLSRGITQAEISAKIGLSRQGYADYERDKCDIPLEKVLRLADAFGLSPIRFMHILGIKNTLGSTFSTDTKDIEVNTLQFLNSISNNQIHSKDLSSEDIELFSTLVLNALEIIKQKYI